MDVEIERPHVHHPVGHRWIDLIVPVAALFVSFLSILIAYHHGQVMKDLVAQNERLVQANSLPYLMFNVGVQVSREDGYVIHTVTNKGAGPAEIRWAQTHLDGQPVKDFSDLLKKCCLEAGEATITAASLENSMLRPGDTIEFASLREGGSSSDLIRKFAEASLSRRIETRACYCSVFKECWIAFSRPSRPQQVQSCPAPSDSNWELPIQLPEAKPGR